MFIDVASSRFERVLFILIHKLFIDLDCKYKKTKKYDKKNKKLNKLLKTINKPHMLTTTSANL